MNVGELVFNLLFQSDTKDAQEFLKIIEELEKKGGDLGSVIQGLGSSLDGLNTGSVASTAHTLEELGFAEEQVTNNTNEAASAINEFAVNTENLSYAAENVNSATQSTVNEVSQLSLVVDEAGTHTDAFGSAMGKAGAEEKNTSQETKKTTKEVQKQNSELSKAAKDGLKKFTKALQDVGTMAMLMKAKVVAAVTGAIGSFVKEHVMAADSINEWRQALEATYGDNIDDIQEWSRNATEQFALTREESMKCLQTMGTMFKTAGHTSENVKTMSTTLTGLSADIAAFTNTDQMEVFNTLQMGMTGSTRALKKMGIVLDDTTLSQQALQMGFADFKSLSETDKQLVRYQAILKATEHMQGGLADSLSQSWANNRKKLGAQLKAISESLFYPAVEGLRRLTYSANKAVSVIRKYVDAQKDKIAKIWADIHRAMTNVFVDMGIYFVKVRKLTKGFEGIKGAAESIGYAVLRLGDLLIPIFAGVGLVIDKVVKALNALLGPSIQAVADEFGGLGSSAFSVFEEIGNLIESLMPIFEEVGKALAPVVSIIAQIASVALKIVSDVMGIITALINGDIDKVIEKFFSLNDNMEKLNDLIIKLVEAAIKVIAGLLRGILTIIKRLCDNIEAKIKEKLGVIRSKIAEFINKVKAKIKEFFTNIWNKITEIKDKIVAKISEIFAPVRDVFDKCAQKVHDFWEFIRNTFTNIWNTIKAKFAPVFDFISNIWQKVKDFASNIWGKITDIVSGVAEKLKTIFDPIITPIVDTFDKVFNGIKNAIGGVADWIEIHVVEPIKKLFDKIEGYYEKFLEVTGLGKIVKPIEEMITGKKEDKKEKAAPEPTKTERAHARASHINATDKNNMYNPGEQEARARAAAGYSEGGVVGGNSYTGDNVLARVNSGEMILNVDQQKNLLNMFKGMANYLSSFRESLVHMMPRSSYSRTSYGNIENSISNQNTFNITVTGSSSPAMVKDFSKQIAPIVDRLMTDCIQKNRAMIATPEWRREA